MYQSYLSDCVVSMCVYKHFNNIQIMTGLWVEKDFLPQVYIFNESETLFLSLKEWDLIYKEYENIIPYKVFTNKIVNLQTLYILLYCEKRCSLSFIDLVCDAIKTFATCVKIRITQLQSQYLKAIEFVQKVEDNISLKCMSSMLSIDSILLSFVCPQSLIELEIVHIGSTYFKKLLAKD